MSTVLLDGRLSEENGDGREQHHTARLISQESEDGREVATIVLGGLAFDVDLKEFRRAVKAL